MIVIALGTEIDINTKTYVAVYDSSLVCDRCSMDGKDSSYCTLLHEFDKTLCSDNDIVWIEKK